VNSRFKVLFPAPLKVRGVALIVLHRLNAHSVMDVQLEPGSATRRDARPHSLRVMGPILVVTRPLPTMRDTAAGSTGARSGP
jgi:hypothetical protein